MNKLIIAPAIAVLTAAGAASAAGFLGGVSAGAVQSGSANDLTCAESARVVEWGTNDHLATPNVENARIKLTDADCAGQGVSLIALTPQGTQLGSYRANGMIADQAPGTQYARISFNQPIPVSDLDAIRITIDPGPFASTAGTN
jgi:hypothetical protein